MVSTRSFGTACVVLTAALVGGCYNSSEDPFRIQDDNSYRESELSEDATLLLPLMIPAGIVLPSTSNAALVAAQTRGPEPDPECVHNLGGDLALEPSVQLHYSSADNRYLLRVDDVDVSSKSSVGVADEVLESSFGPVLGCMGVSSAESSLVFGTLSRAGGTIGLPETTEPVARKVYVERRVLGVSVPGDYIVATYSLDGRLFGFHGRWRRADFANSELAIPGLTVEDVLLRAAESLVERSVNIRPSVYAIEVSTLYRARPSAQENDIWDLHLYGRAAIRDSDGNGSGQEGKIPSYDFPLGQVEVKLGLDAESANAGMEEGGGDDSDD